jgi:hypothetical protein
MLPRKACTGVQGASRNICILTPVPKQQGLCSVLRRGGVAEALQSYAADTLYFFTPGRVFCSLVYVVLNRAATAVIEHFDVPVDEFSQISASFRMEAETVGPQ